jgi:ABC-type lipoprotein release transport system permease subunit
VLVLLVTHKRTEIGALMAMGLSRRSARRILTSVGLVLSSAGVLGGLILGLFLCWLIDTFPVFKLPDIYYDTRIPVLVDYKVIAAMLAVSAAVAALSSWLPARFVTRASPSQLLRSMGETARTDGD